MNVLIFSSQSIVLPQNYTPVYVKDIAGLESAANRLKYAHERFVIMNTCAEAVLFAYKKSYVVVNARCESMYSVLDADNTDAISDVFYTVKQMKIRALIESISSVKEAARNSHYICKMIDSCVDFISEDTLQDIVKNSAKSTSIYGHVISAYKNYTDAFESKVRSMIFPANARLIDNKTFVPSGFVVNTSEMGTSKSESNINLFDSALKAGRNPMVFVPNISLASPFSMRDEHYKNICNEDGRAIVKQGAITTINSARITAHADLIENGSVKIFDEAIKLFEHINGDAFFDGKIADKKAGFKFVFDQMKSSPDVVISDAHFGQAYIDIVKSVTGREIQAVEMSRGAYKNTNVHAGNLKVEDLIFKAKKHLKAGEYYCYYSDRKQDGAVANYKELASYAESLGLKTILINAAEMSDETGEAFKATVNPDAELSDKSLIFFTPAIGPGFSARLPKVKTILMDCCGTVSPISLIQTALRFRCVEDIYISFSLRKPACDYPETRSDVCYRTIQESSLLSENEVWHGLHTQITYMNERHNKLLEDKNLCAAFDIKALENWSRNRYKQFTLTAMKLLGFKMINAFTDADNVACEKPKKIARIRAEKEEVKQVFLSEEVLDSKLAELMLSDKCALLSLHNSRLLEKFKAARMMGIKSNFTEEDYEFVEKNGLSVIANISLVSEFKTVNFTRDLLNKALLIRDVVDFVKSQTRIKDGFQNKSMEDFIKKLKGEKAVYNGKQISKLTLIKNYFMLHIDPKDARKATNVIIGLAGYRLVSNKNIKVKDGEHRVNGNTLDTSLNDAAKFYISNA